MKGLFIADVSDPAHPHPLASLSTNGFATSVTLAGNYAYLAQGVDELSIIDISNPCRPVQVDTVADTEGHHVQIVKDYAYLSGFNFAILGNLPGMGILRQVKGFSIDHLATDVTAVDNYVYVTDYGFGLFIVDVSDPAKPNLLSTLSTNKNAYGVAVAGNYAYVADSKAGLFIADVSDLAHPHSLVSLPTEDARGIAVVGNYAYVADKISGLFIANVTDPAHPHWLASVPTNGGAYSVTVSGNYAYVAESAGGLFIANVTNPADPHPLASVQTEYALDIAVVGNYAYVANGLAGLFIANVTDPVHPHPLVSLPVMDAQRVAVSDKYAYVVTTDSGLFIVDVSNPKTPNLIGSISMSGLPQGIFIKGVYVYIANIETGLNIFSMDSYHMSGTPLSFDRRPYTIELTATDFNETSTTTSFRIDFPNVPPKAQPINPLVVHVNSPFSFSIKAFFSDADSNVGEQLTYTATLADGSPLSGGWLTFNPDSGVFSGKPKTSNRGSHPIRVTATDRFGKSDSAYFTVIVVNDRVTVANGFSTMTLAVGDKVSEKIPKDAFYDPNDDQLTYSADLGSAKAWLHFKDNEFSGTPKSVDAAAYRNREYNVKVTASDGLTDATANWNIVLKGPSATETALNIIMSLGSACVTAFGFYKKRYWFWNIFKKKQYMLSDETIAIGNQSYKHKISLPVQEIKEIIVTRFTETKRAKNPRTKKICDNFALRSFIEDAKERHFDGGSNAYIFDWLDYDVKSNSLIAKNGGPEAKDTSKVRIAIIDTENRIREQFDIQVGVSASTEVVVGSSAAMEEVTGQVREQDLGMFVQTDTETPPK